MATQLKNGETLLFIGDSITDMGRRNQNRPLGDGYVKFVQDLLILREPAKSVCILNKGIGGDTVTGLRERWTDDVLRNRPDWLSIKIGINDLHRALFFPDDAQKIPPSLYEEVYDEILAATRKALPKCRLLLIEPFYISNAKAPSTRRREVLKKLPEYHKVVRAMSRKYKTRLVKTHGLFQKLLKHHEPDTFCPEPVHPHATGHLAIAEAVYDALSRPAKG